ncbi:MAG: hypothetical protein D3923_05240, partial [Candidatus Electrothrix sp. AR3]|nr:hypothetical protein [Candidatus Electrothrix sp. AR3]
MYVFTFRLVVLLIVFCTALLTQPVLANDNFSKLVNKAGMQRMLSQRMAKAYFYHGNDILKKDMRMQLKLAIKKFTKNHNDLIEKVKDNEIQEILSRVHANFAKINTLVTQPYNKKNAALVLELSETLLQDSHEVALKIEALSGLNIDHIINISGKQRMLSQRISKY